MLTGERLTIGTFLRKFCRPIGVTWVLTLCETTLLALIPLFIGFAIDGLLEGRAADLIHLLAVLGSLVAVSVIRRLYDTRVYGTIRVEIGRALAARANGGSVSATNARLGMGRELIDFLEQNVPTLLTSVVQLLIAVVVLYAFHPFLAYAALGSGTLMLLAYGACHRRFFRLNAALNQQAEKQVGILETRVADGIKAHLTRIRRIEIGISDTEAYVYGAIFVILLGFLVFNLWFAAANVDVTAGTIFAIVSYSWEFADSALVLPATLQNWSRLSEIMQRINR